MKPPLQYSGILLLAKEIVCRHGYSDAKLQSGDPYAGKAPDEDKQSKAFKLLQEDVEHLKKANKPGSSGQAGGLKTNNGTRGSRAARGGRGRGAYQNVNTSNNNDVNRNKLAVICRKFNSSSIPAYLQKISQQSGLWPGPLT